MAEETELTFVRCPSCRSLMPAIATKCRMCGFQMESSPTEASPNDASKSEIESKIEVKKEEIKKDDATKPKRSTQNIPKTTVDEIKAAIAVDVLPPPPMEDKKIEEKKSFSFQADVQQPKKEEPGSKSGLSFKVQPQNQQQPKIDIVKQAPNPQPIPQSTNTQQNQNRPQQPSPQQPRPLELNKPTNEQKVVSNEQRQNKPSESKVNVAEVRNDVRQNDNRQNDSRVSLQKNNPSPKQEGNRQENTRPEGNRPEALRSEGNRQEAFVQRSKNPGKLVGWLLSFSESEKGTSYELRQGKCFIAKNKLRDNDIVINRDSISTPHMLLDIKNEEVRAQDMLSDHGVLVNQGGEYKDLGEIVNLKHGDKIKVGDLEFLVCLAKF